MTLDTTRRLNDTIAQWVWLVLPVTLLIDFAHFLLRGQFKFVSQYFASDGWQHYAFGLATMTVLPSLFVLLSGARKLSRMTWASCIALGMALSVVLVAKGFNTDWLDIAVTVLLPMGALTASTALVCLLPSNRTQEGVPAWASLYWRIFALALLLAVGISSFLEITPVIFPGTYDYVMHHLDAAYSHPAAGITSAIAAAPEFVRSGLTLVYNALGWVFLPMVALVHRERKDQGLHIWRTYIYSLGLATLCYAFLPVSGPLYAFGPELFPARMTEVTQVPAVVATIPPALRNGMPSMHFTSAVTMVFVAAALRNKLYFAGMLLFWAATALATMGFGEHYLIDLVVALTYSVTLSTLLIAPARYLARGAVAKWALILSGATFIGWMALFKFASGWLMAHLGVVQMLTVWSAMLFFLVGHHFIRAVWHMPADSTETQPVAAPPTLLPTDLKGNYWIIGVFFASGVAGLIYEVVFAKALAVTFGASSLATNTVLATYMGGMAIGAWAGSKIAQRTAHPLRLYAYCEALIGLYALLTPQLFQVIQKVYVGLVLDRPADAPELTALRLLLGAATLGPATLLMGATFPIMFARLRQVGMASERAIAPLYAANVAGAAFGALLAGYALIPAVGKNSATYIAALLSLLVALYALEKQKSAGSGVAVEPTSPVKLRPPPVALGVGVVALTILAVGGAVTLGLEVVFMHMLAVVAGNSVYAFGLMLATFLLGLGLGSATGERAITYIGRERVVILAQWGLACAIVISSLQWDALAGYFAYFGPYEASGIHITFSGRELIRALVCAVAMLPPAFFIGMSYPACMGLATDWLGRNGEDVSGLGQASGINTLGNIVGVLVAGFWLLPEFGSRDTLLCFTLVALLTGLLMAGALFANARSEVPFSRQGWGLGLAFACTGGLALFFPLGWDLDKMSQGSNVYFYPQEWGSVIDHAESTEGGLTTVTKSDDGLLTLLTNGKFQGNNSEQGEMVAQKSFALIPMLHVARRGNALVIGYGTGMTPRVIHENEFQSLDIAELSRDMVRLADRHFENINHAVTSRPGVHTYYTDGRNFLLTQSKKYDLISIEISSIWFAGAANLYNKEFYELVARRLDEGGVLQQWIQLHHMQPLDFLYAVESLRSAFKYVWFYMSGGQGIVVASNSEEARPGLEQSQTLERTMKDGDLSIADLEKRLLADPKQIDAMLLHFDPSMRALLSTDNNLYLEYATPKGNALRYDTLPLNLKLLMTEYPQPRR